MNFAKRRRSAAHSRRAIEVKVAQLCQHLGCLSIGIARQKRFAMKGQDRGVRTIFLCDPCFRLLQAYQLYELFLRVGTLAEETRN